MNQRKLSISNCGLISSYDPGRIREKLSDRFTETLTRLQIDQSISSRIKEIHIPLAAILTEIASAHPGPMIVGINGAQGSGKSTLCELLTLVLESGFGLNVAGFSIDDIYTTLAERTRMARDVHPLLQTRGVPGTHDLKLGNQLLDALRSEEARQNVLIPTFDKAIDDRRPPEQWRQVKTPFDIILFEGWCVGAHPQDEKSLIEPVNELEAREDADGRWRRHVNHRLATDYAAFFNKLDVLIMMQIPDFDYVYKWRRLQEKKLASSSAARSRVMDDSDLRRFIMHYERLTRHMLTVMPQRADILLPLDPNHQIRDIVLQDHLLQQ